MTKVEKLEQAVASLAEKDYHQFRQWFQNQDWEKWDREIEADSKAGRLDFLMDEAAEAKSKNKLRDL